MSEYNTQITMKHKTCSKGHICSVPHWASEHYFKCPFCAVEEIRGLREQIADQASSIYRKYRQISALKGVITKLRNRYKERD